MIYGSVCSGIEAATVAWHPLGWRPAWFAEIAAFPSKVLAHHYPEVPNHGDFTRITDAGAIDLLVGGTPCQSFSVAGLRKGLDDERGNLALEFLRLAHRARPEWVVWENVPGVLSIDDGRAFGSILGGLAELGYGWAYRVLDAQFYGVPQRRRRVFVVGHLGDWRRAAAVLFERACLSWDPPPGRATGADVAGTLGAGTSGGGWCNDLERSGAFIPELASTLRASYNASPGDGSAGTPIIPVAFQCHGGNVGPMGTLRAGNGNETGGVPFVAFGSKGHGQDAGDISPTLRGAGFGDSRPNGGVMPAIAFHMTQDPISGPEAPALGAKSGGMGVALFDDPRRFDDRHRGGDHGDTHPTMRSTNPSTLASDGFRVRRLTPRECERLQGLPDDYTGIPGAKDGPRYAAIGNSMAVPVMAWIGRRIEAVRGITNTNTDRRKP